MGKSSFQNHRGVLRIVLCLLAGVFIWSMTIPTYAAESTKTRRSVRVGAFTGSGYHQCNKDGTISGYGCEYETLLEQYADWDITYVRGSWSQLQNMLADGEIDLLGFLIPTSERKKIYDFAEYPSGTSTSCLIVAEDNDTYAYEDFQSFDGMRIAYQEKNANVDSLRTWCERKGCSVELIPYSNYEKVYQAIDTGEADAGLATSFYDLTDYKIIANIGSTDFYYAVKKGNKELFEELNKAVLAIRTYYPTLETDLYDQFYESGNGRGDTFTAEEYAYLKTHPTITVLAGGRGAPFEKWDSKSQTYSGFVPDILEQVAKVTGLKFQYQKTNDQLAYVADHETESVISSMTCDAGWAHKNGWSITQPFIKAGVSIITKDEPGNIQTVGMNKENYLRNHIRTNHPDWIIQTYATMDDRLEAVYDRTCDATLMNSYEAEYYLSSGKYRLLHETISSETTQNIGFGVSKGSDPRLFSVISKALLMIDSDTYDTLMRDNLDYEDASIFFSLIYTNPLQVLLVIATFAFLGAAVLFLVFYTISIRRKNREVMEATQVKTDFFSRMSHDMRTPMNGILGMTALSKGETDPAILQNNIGKIEASGRYMLTLINDTLDMQKLETGKMELNIQGVYARDYLSDLIDMMKPNAQVKDIQFECENVNIDLEHDVYLDQTRIKQAFSNLLSNAIKFTPPGGMIRFTAECMGKDGDIEHDRFRVIDSGIGMSREFLENRVFKPYSQEDTTITSKYGGTGLGLAITKNIIQAMGGSISVESTLGEGSCFTILLDFKVSKRKEKPAEPAKIPEKKASQDALRNKKILLCEDHPLNAEIATRLLKKAGCEVVHGENGKIGVDLFTASGLNDYDAILMDVRMPNMDGITATKIIRSLDREDSKTIPIIAMTANAFQEDVRQCMEAGMTAHLAKPVNPSQLYLELETYILQ